MAGPILGRSSSRATSRLPLAFAEDEIRRFERVCFMFTSSFFFIQSIFTLLAERG
jgi:hypothetical protein